MDSRGIQAKRGLPEAGDKRSVRQMVTPRWETLAHPRRMSGCHSQWPNRLPPPAPVTPASMGIRIIAVSIIGIRTIIPVIIGAGSPPNARAPAPASTPAAPADLFGLRDIDGRRSAQHAGRIAECHGVRPMG